MTVEAVKYCIPISPSHHNTKASRFYFSPFELNSNDRHKRQVLLSDRPRGCVASELVLLPDLPTNRAEARCACVVHPKGCHFSGLYRIRTRCLAVRALPSYAP